MTDLEAYERGWKAAVKAVAKVQLTKGGVSDADIQELADMVTIPRHDFIDLTGRNVCPPGHKCIPVIGGR